MNDFVLLLNVSDGYQDDISDADLVKIDRAIALLAEEQAFSLVRAALAMQLEWLGAVKPIFVSLNDLTTLSDVVVQLCDAEADDFQKVMSDLIGIYLKQSYAADAEAELREQKERTIGSLGWKKDDKIAILQLLSVEMASIPESFTNKIIRERRQLCKRFPELNDEVLTQKIVEYRMNLVVERTPSEMDDFRQKLINLMKKAVADKTVVDQVNAKYTTWMQDALTRAQNETFVIDAVKPN